MQCREARLDGCNDMRLHGVVAVDMDAEAADRRDQLNCDAVDTYMPSWDLMLTSLWRAPQDFRIAGIQVSRKTTTIE